MRTLLKNTYVRNILFALGGLFMGWLIFHSSHKTSQEKQITVTKSEAETWTCSMHPQIKIDHPGKCPICAMDLITLTNHSISTDSLSVHLTKDAIELAHVQTSIVSRQNAEKEIRLYGKVQTDERLLQSQVAHIPGRIEKLVVNFTGETVRKGQTLAMLYSPELITTQQELIEAAKTKTTMPDIYEAAKEKLHQWKLTDKQITSIEQTGKIQSSVEIKATTSGIVTARRVNTGDYISQGAVLYDIADLSHVWILFDAYESDLLFLNKGNKINFTLQALPGTIFQEKITFIDAVVDPTTRISKVRVEVNNKSGLLKPEMFATGVVNANLPQYRDKLIIPRSSVLWTGKRSIVYVKDKGTDNYTFKMREIELGPMLGNSYVITNGLTEGEEVVTQGAFSIDAAAQLEGKPSMMNKPIQNEQSLDKSSNQTQNQENKHISFKVSGSCEMCKERIETTAKQVNGVKSARWNVESKKIEIEYNPHVVQLLSIHKAIAKAGHDTDKAKADNKTYQALPECCLYRAK